MRSQFLQDWASWVILIPDNELRMSDENAVKLKESKHQKQIIKIQKHIKEVSETGSVETARELVSVEPIKCRGETRFVAHCRYLQYCVSWLKKQDFIHLNEGKEEK